MSEGLLCLACGKYLTPFEWGCTCSDPEPSLDGRTPIGGPPVPPERLAALLEEMQGQYGRWVTYDEFETWRNRHPAMTSEEKVAVTLAVANHMVWSLRTGNVRYKEPCENEPPVVD